MNDMDPKQQKFPLILWPFAAAIWMVCAVQTALAHAGIIKPPPKEYENNWRGLPW